MSSTAVPKFASFKAKPKAPEQPPPEEPRSKEKEHSRLCSSRGKARAERTRSPPREKQERPREESHNKLYFSDRRGDLDIVKYGTLNRYDVPRYRRSGYGNVLGVSYQKIDRERSSDQKIYLIPLVRQQQKRLLTDKHVARESRRTLRLVKAAENHQADAKRDFIALSGTQKRKRDGSSGSGDDVDAPAVDYRGIGEQPDPDKADDPDTYFESDVEASTVNSEVTQKNSRLIRETRDEPGNLQAWLDLIEHQEPMMKLDRAIAELSTADRRNLADVRISTYEEALRKVGSDEASRIELQVGLLREAQRHWDDAKLAVKWQQVLAKHTHSVRLWLGYVDFVQSTFSMFKYEDCRTAFIKALEALRSASSKNDATTTEARLHLFVRLTAMIQDAGYQELALAVWQACFEFNILSPQEFTSDKLDQFEEFWESEAPRIGEPDSKGWKATSIEEAAPPCCSVILEIADSSRPSLLAFQKCETERVSKLRYPGRSTDDVGDEDPFHTIFFSDLKDYIANFPDVSAGMLVDAFLCFCGLPPLVGTDMIGSWWDDPFLQRRYTAESTKQAESGSLRYQEALSRYLECPLGKCRMTQDLLIQQTFPLSASRLSPEFIRHALKLLATNSADDELIGEYLLAFEARHFPLEVAKSAKRLLKHRPSSVRLYNMYGLIEVYLGNLAKADQILSAALNIKASIEHRLQLSSSYTWQALRKGDKTEALRRLIEVKASPQPQISPPSPDHLRTAQAAFQKALEEALLRQDYHCAVLNASHLALLTYISSDFNITAALEVHNNLTAWFASHKLTSSTHAELHAQATAHLLAHHATHTPIMKPALLRTVLEPLIATFPSNTLLISTYAANEARFSIDDRVRGNMHRVLNVSPKSSVVTWAFAIHHETLRGEIAGSTAHSIRALYKRATSPDAAGAHCPALWHLYLSFELGQLSKEKGRRVDSRPRKDGKKSKWEMRIEDAEGRVRETFYGGLKMVPWCKDFVMKAFTDVEGAFGDEELWRLYGVMVEKEMRVYTEMEGVGV
jgi:tetratricopeptide (TPR) repeat protein